MNTPSTLRQNKISLIHVFFTLGNKDSVVHTFWSRVLVREASAAQVECTNEGEARGSTRGKGGCLKGGTGALGGPGGKGPGRAQEAPGCRIQDDNRNSDGTLKVFLGGSKESRSLEGRRFQAFTFLLSPHEVPKNSIRISSIILYR